MANPQISFPKGKLYDSVRNMPINQQAQVYSMMQVGKAIKTGYGKVRKAARKVTQWGEKLHHD